MRSNSFPTLTIRRGALALLLLTALVYADGLGGGFLWDDEYFFISNPRVHDETVRSAFTSDLWFSTEIKDRFYNYRPLALLAYSWMARLFQFQPFGMHLVSLLLHAATGILVFLLVLEFAEMRVAWLTAALFIVHPLHVEAVAWMTGVSEVLAGALMVLSLYTLMRARSQGRWLLAVSYLAAVLSFFTKETALALPLMAALLVGIRAWPFFTLAAGSLAVRFLAIGFVAARLTPRPLWGHLRIVAITALQYGQKMIWPWPVAPEYDYHYAGAAWVAFAVGCAGVAWLAWRYAHLRLAILLLVAALSPALASGIAESVMMLARDRNAYVAILGLALAIGYAARDRRGWTAGLALVCLWGVLSFFAVAHWRDTESLWAHTLRVTPNSRSAVIYLMGYYYSQMQFEEADRVLRQGLVWRPNDRDLLGYQADVQRQLKARAPQR